MVIPPKRRSPKQAHIRSCTGAKNKSFEKLAQIDLKHINIYKEYLVGWLLGSSHGYPPKRRSPKPAHIRSCTGAKNKSFEKGAQIELKHINIDKEELVVWLLGSSYGYPP